MPNTVGQARAWTRGGELWSWLRCLLLDSILVLFLAGVLTLTLTLTSFGEFGGRVRGLRNGGWAGGVGIKARSEKRDDEGSRYREWLS